MAKDLLVTRLERAYKGSKYEMERLQLEALHYIVSGINALMFVVLLILVLVVWTLTRLLTT